MRWCDDEGVFDDGSVASFCGVFRVVHGLEHLEATPVRRGEPVEGLCCDDSSVHVDAAVVLEEQQAHDVGAQRAVGVVVVVETGMLCLEEVLVQRGLGDEDGFQWEAGRCALSVPVVKAVKGELRNNVVVPIHPDGNVCEGRCAPQGAGVVERQRRMHAAVDTGRVARFQ